MKKTSLDLTEEVKTDSTTLNQSQTVEEPNNRPLDQHYEIDRELHDWYVDHMNSKGENPITFEQFRTEKVDAIKFHFSLYLDYKSYTGEAPVPYEVFEKFSFNYILEVEKHNFEIEQEEMEYDLIEEDEECFA